MTLVGCKALLGSRSLHITGSKGGGKNKIVEWDPTWESLKGKKLVKKMPQQTTWTIWKNAVGRESTEERVPI